MLQAALGLVEIILGLGLLHCILPLARRFSFASGGRTWAFGFALITFGATDINAGLGWPVDPAAYVVARICLLVAAALWIERLIHSPVKGG